MTPRSPKKHQQPTTTTISRSRRLRNRADQNLAVQPSEVSQFRSVRPRRAAPLRHNSADYSTPEPQPPSLAWNTPDTLENIPRTISSIPTRFEENRSDDLRLTQTLDFSQYESPRRSQSDALSSTGDHESRSYQVQSAPRLTFPPSPLPSVSGSHNPELRLSADPEQRHDPFLELQDMSALGFMMPPSQYGMNHYDSPPTSYPPSYPPQPSYADSRSPTSGPYGSSFTSSPVSPHEHQPRRPGEHIVMPPYQQQPQSLPRSPYEQPPPLSTMRGDSAPLSSTAHSYTYPAPHSNIPSQSRSSSSTAYLPQPLYPPVTYGMSDYHPLSTMYPQTSTAPSAYHAYGSPHDIPQAATGSIPALSSSPGAQNNAVMPRILNSRPKPQCWEHGCNGRQFSTFSNLLRHQREKSGTASKSYCPRCNAEFTRTTARNGHMAHDKCKPRRASDTSQ